MRKLVLTLLVVLGCVVPGLAATPALVQCKNDTGQPQITTDTWKVNLPNPTQSGNTITASVFVGNSSTTYTVSDDKTNTWSTDTTKIADGGNNTGLNISYAMNVAAGTQQITVTYSVARAFNQVQVCEWRNVAGVSALDGQGGRVTTTGTITTGNFTTSTAGDLIIQVAALDNWPAQSAPMVWTAGTGMALAIMDDTSYMATQYGIQVSASASTNPSITSSITPTGSGVVTKAIALKSAVAGSAPPAGIYVDNISVMSLENGTSYATYSGTAFSFQVPVSATGNTIATAWTGRPTNKPTVTSTPSLSWSSCAASADSGGSGNAVWWWWAPNASAGVVSVTFTFASTPGTSVHNLLDIVGADTDQSAAAATCASTDPSATNSSIANGASGPVAGATITPATANGLVLSVAQEDRETVTNVSPGYFEATDVAKYSVSSGDTDQGLAIYYNVTTAAVPIIWTYSGYESGGNGPGAYASQSVALKASGGGGGGGGTGGSKNLLLGVGSN